MAKIIAREKPLIKVQQLGCVGDLDLLIRGDVVKVIFEGVNLREHGRSNEFAAYHAKIRNQFQFLVPMESRESYIVMYRATRNQIRVEKGKIILREGNSVTQSYSPNRCPEYDSLEKTLSTSKLR